MQVGQAAFLRVTEAAVVLGLSRSATYHMANVWLDTGGRAGLPAVRVGRRILIPRRAVDRLAAIGTEDGRTPDLAS